MRIDYNVLGQILDTTWGRSSSPNTSSYSVKFDLKGDELIVKYVAIVAFASEVEKVTTKRQYDRESRTIIAEVVRKIKSLYKDYTGSTLKMKIISSEDNIEIIGFAVHNPKRTAYYRRISTFTFVD